MSESNTGPCYIFSQRKNLKWKRKMLPRRCIRKSSTKFVSSSERVSMFSPRWISLQEYLQCQAKKVVFTVLPVNYCTCSLSADLSSRAFFCLLVKKSTLHTSRFPDLFDRIWRKYSRRASCFHSSITLRFHWNSAIDNTNYNFIV